MYRNKRFNRRSNILTTTNSNGAKRPKEAEEDKATKTSTGDNDSVKTTVDVQVHNSNNDQLGTDRDNLEDIFSSEENIPSSQQPTERYLSQRSIMAASLARTQSRINASQLPNSYFELVLQKAGVKTDDPEKLILDCDHITMVSRLKKIFITAPNYPDNISSFKTGLRQQLEPKTRMSMKLLTGCSITVPNSSTFFQSHNSMIVNFLMIDFLRTPVVEILLEKCEKLACGSSQLLFHSGVDIFALMLLQLRYVVSSQSNEIFDRIKSIYRKANKAAKWDILNSAEFILVAQKHDEFARLLLSDIKDSSELFNTGTINALAKLSLSSSMIHILRQKIVRHVKENQCADDLFPSLIKLMLNILLEKSDTSMRELAESFREIILWRANSSTRWKSQYQLEAFTKIEQGLIISKPFYHTWQKIIAALPEQQFKSLDFIILLLLVNIKEDNLLCIENLLKRKIRNEMISVNILNEMKLKYAPVLEKYETILMQILNDFLRDKHPVIVNFTRSAFGILFEICEAVQKSIVRKLLTLSFDKSSSNMANIALELLKEIQTKYPKEIQNWGILFVPLLDRLNERSLSQTRLVMEILCLIAYPAIELQECSQLQDQVDMVVKKQLISQTPSVKQQGIIGSVQLIDCIARIEESPVDDEDLNKTYQTVSSLPEDSRGKTAAILFECVLSVTKNSPESVALFFDELATVCGVAASDRSNRGFLDKPFLIWLCESVTYYFQSNFITEEAVDAKGKIPLEYRKCINSLEDTNTEDADSSMLSIGINIGELVLNPKPGALNSILILSPIFNLLRNLHLMRYTGSLESINALLGCSIILPNFFEDPNAEVKIFNDYTEAEQKKILDIYFHCVNWMRETVSSFTTQRVEMIRVKVLKRLMDLIDIESTIRSFLKRAPADYEPPKCQFLSSRTSKVAPTHATAEQNRLKANNQVGNTLAIDDTADDASLMNAANDTELDVTKKARGKKDKKSDSPTGTKTFFENLYGPKEIYRQMDSNIMLILHEKLSLKHPFPAADGGYEISLLQFRFVLYDLVCKLESITGIHKFHSEQALQYIAKPHYFLKDLSKFLKNIFINMRTISRAINARLEKANHVLSNSDLFTDDFSYLKVCLGLCLRLFAAYFSWSEFTENSRETLLKESLKTVLMDDESPNGEEESITELAQNAFNAFMKYEKSIVELKTAVHLNQLLETLKRLTAIDGTKDILDKQALEIRSLCKTFLQRKWHNYEGRQEKGAACNTYLNELVRGFLSNSDFKRQFEVLHVVSHEARNLNGKDCVMKSFPNITKANFPILYRGHCEILISTLNNVIEKNYGCIEGDKLKVWERSCDILNSLLEVLKEVIIPRNFAIFAKYANIYLKLVLQHGLIVFETALRQDPERVGGFVRSLQTSTRYLHHLCCHSKAIKNTAIINQIPCLRETVEMLVFRIKALLAANKCSEVFTMGDLKNKDIHGDYILSQTATLNSTHEEGSDEEIPDDDQSVDETIFQGNHDEVEMSTFADMRIPNRCTKS